MCMTCLTARVRNFFHPCTAELAEAREENRKSQEAAREMRMVLCVIKDILEEGE